MSASMHPPRMTADQFIAWSIEQSADARYELVAGAVVLMAPERSAHALTKLRIARRLDEAVEAARLPCQVFPDGMAVEIDMHTVYEPDALLRCGRNVPDDAIKLTDPLIVVEVRSASTAGRDAGVKLADYFRIPTLRHYLIVNADTRTIIHHVRDDQGLIATRIVRDGSVSLDPPGIVLDRIFPP